MLAFFRFFSCRNSGINNCHSLFLLYLTWWVMPLGLDIDHVLLYLFVVSLWNQLACHSCFQRNFFHQLRTTSAANGAGTLVAQQLSDHIASVSDRDKLFTPVSRTTLSSFTIFPRQTALQLNNKNSVNTIATEVKNWKINASSFGDTVIATGFG